ncbi:MAG: hypothetical protein ACLFO2_01765 [Candidatus Woesearchaeota archaeon]
MAEFKTLVWLKPLRYSGLLDMKGLYKTIDKWLAENHYDKVESKNFEHVEEGHRQIILELMPYKKVSDYARIDLRIYVELTNLTEEVVTKGGVKQKYYRGDAFFSFDAFLVTDYEDHWETRPAYYFIRTLVDKFVYKGYMKRFQAEGKADCMALINEIKNYLNMERFK